jgi:hypothetical protein
MSKIKVPNVTPRARALPTHGAEWTGGCPDGAQYSAGCFFVGGDGPTRLLKASVEFKMHRVFLCKSQMGWARTCAPLQSSSFSETVLATDLATVSLASKFRTVTTCTMKRFSSRRLCC